jgi:DNA-binding transcriptional LysR family regulator
MEIKQLQHLIAVVDAGGFSLAARRLGLTQQAVSKSLQTLERSVGLPLLDRSGRRVRPTDAGRNLLAHANTVVAELRAFEAGLRNEHRGRQEKLRLGTSPTATAPVATPAALAVSRAHPGIRIEVTGGLRRDLLPMLERGDLDAVVCLDIEEHRDRTLKREVLCDDEYAVVAGRRHPLCRRDDVETADLVEWPWILGRNLGDVASAWESVWKDDGLPAPVPVMETNSLDFCRLALRDSQCLTILPRGLVAADVVARRLQIIPVADFAWDRPISLYRLRSAAMSPPLESLVTELRRAAEAWRS